MALRLREAAGQACDDDIREQHSDSGRQPQLPATSSLRVKRSSVREEEVPDRKAAVDAGDLAVVRDADELEDGGEVIGDDAVSDPYAVAPSALELLRTDG